MALFGRKKAARTNEIEFVVDAGIRFLAAQGIHSTLRETIDPENPQIVASTGKVYPLYNLVQKCKPAPEHAWPGIVAEHFGSLLQSDTQPDPAQLDAASLSRMVRTRLLRADPGDPVDLSYARPFAPGVALGLAIDYPHTVATLTAAELPGLALDIDDLYRFGQANTDAESAATTAIGDGIWAMEGESFFVASKAANMARLVPETIGPAPLGVAFALPQRSLMLYVVVESVEAVSSISGLVRIADSMAHSGEYALPGGFISDDVYFWIEGKTEVITSRTPGDPSVSINGSGVLGSVLSSLSER